MSTATMGALVRCVSPSKDRSAVMAASTSRHDGDGIFACTRLLTYSSGDVLKWCLIWI